MRFDGGRMCLDLAATGAPGQPAEPDGEELRDAEGLARWLRGVGLIPASTPLTVDSGWLPPFRELRDLLGRLVACALDTSPARPADIDGLNRFARPAPPAPAAVPSGDADGLRKELAAPPTWESLASVVARDAVDLLTDPAARGRLRRCEGERCARVYLDTSRGRRRRWCSSEVCGNRERVARHRRRTLSSSQG